MFSKSVWNLSLGVCLMLASWSTSSAFYLPRAELGKPLHNIWELKPMLHELLDNVKQIFDVVQDMEELRSITDSSPEQFGRTAELEFTNRVLVRTIEQLTKDHTRIEGLMKLKTENLKDELAANVAALKELKTQMAKIEATNEEQAKLVYGFFTTDDDPKTEQQWMGISVPIDHEDWREVVSETHSDEDAVESEGASESPEERLKKDTQGEEASEHVPHEDEDASTAKSDEDALGPVTDYPNYENAAEPEPRDYAELYDENVYSRFLTREY